MTGSAGMQPQFQSVASGFLPPGVNGPPLLELSMGAAGNNEALTRWNGSGDGDSIVYAGVTSMPSMSGLISPVWQGLQGQQQQQQQRQLQQLPQLQQLQQNWAVQQAQKEMQQIQLQNMQQLEQAQQMQNFRQLRNLRGR